MLFLKKEKKKIKKKVRESQRWREKPREKNLASDMFLGGKVLIKNVVFLGWLFLT